MSHPGNISVHASNSQSPVLTRIATEAHLPVWKRQSGHLPKHLTTRGVGRKLGGLQSSSRSSFPPMKWPSRVYFIFWANPHQRLFIVVLYCCYALNTDIMNQEICSLIAKSVGGQAQGTVPFLRWPTPTISKYTSRGAQGSSANFCWIHFFLISSDRF